jgi:hypothetical protein
MRASRLAPVDGTSPEVPVIAGSSRFIAWR